MVHRTGGDLVTSAAGITNAEHARWQRHAVSELAAILDAQARLPVIASTAGPAGGLSGPVTGPVPAGMRAAFAGWQDALGLDDVLETGCDDRPGVCLRARAWRNGARVSVTFKAGDGQDQRAVTA